MLQQADRLQRRVASGEAVAKSKQQCLAFAGACNKGIAYTLFAVSLGLAPFNVHALVISSELEALLVKNVTTSWQTVSLTNSYADAIVVCTYNLQALDAANPPAVPRISNITAGSFDLRIQGWEDSAATTNNVHCIIAEEGAHTLPDGARFEAHKVDSDQTNGQFSTDGGWDLALMEDVTGSIQHTYTNPVVLGQVMSFNDNRASVIYVTDCVRRQNYPFQSGGLCVGKHIGQIPSSRNTETIGYIVAEAGSGTVNNVFYELALGADAIAGSGTTGSYGLASDHNIGVLTQAGEDGGNGSWAVLTGNDPLPNGQMILNVDEEIFDGDVTRRHTNEHVYYWTFAGADITLRKTLVNDGGGSAVIGDFSLIATGPDVISGIHGAISVTNQPVHPGTYVLSETNLPGYVASAWSCTGTTVSSGNTITLAGGDDVVCTIVNDDEAVAWLTLEKVVKNNHGGTAVVSDFVLSYDDGSGNSGSGVSASAAVTSVAIPPGTYKLSETALSGYELAQIRCDGSDADGLDGLDLNAAEDVTCQFDNTDLGVDLDIEKSVDNPAPNIGDVLTFTLDVTNNGPDAATNLTVNDILPAGFSYVASSIAGGTSNNDSSPAGSGLQWVISNLGSGTSASLTFQATVLAP